MTPKSLLRHPDAKSSFDDFLEDKEFQRLIPEEGVASQNPSDVQKLIFCSGKVYYDITKERAANEKQGQIAVARVEQLTPFPFDLVKQELSRYPDAKVVWVQEEHKNMGGWSYVQPRVQTVMKNIQSNREVEYVGRHCSPATATGNKHQHLVEQSKFLEAAMAL